MMLRVPGRTILWCACLLLAIGVFARGPMMPAVGAQAGGQPTADRAALRAMFDDDAVFEQLSGARRSQLERLFGPKGALGRSEPPEAGEHATEPAAPLALLAEPVVNNVAADTTESDTQSETAIVLGSASNVVAAFNNSAVSTANNHFTGRSQSANGGAAWSDGGALPNSTNGDAGSPVLARDYTTGRLYLSTLCFTTAACLQVFRSDDDGATWTAPVNAMAVGDLDKEWMAVDNFNGSGRGNVYLFARDFAAVGGGMKLARSTDGGLTWNAPQTVLAGGGQGAFVTVGTDHAVHAFWYDSSASPRTIKGKKSTDRGITFSTAVTVATLTGTGVNGDLGLEFRTNSFPQAAVNPVSGNLYVVYNDKNGADRGDIYLRQSTDGGATWSSAVSVSSDASGRDQTMPTLAVTPDGSRLFVGWYDRRSDPANSLLERWGAIATIAGGTLTFGPNFRISNGSFPVVVNQDPLLSATYMGDYDQAVADNSFFYTAWGDNRLATAIHANQPDVRFQKIPVAGPGGIVSYVSSTPASLDTGTCNNVTVTLKNVGTSTATGVSGTLSTAVPGVVIDQAASTFSNMAPGATATNASLFKIRFTGGFVCGTKLDLTLSVTTASDGSFSMPFRLGTTFTVGAPARFDRNTSTPLPDVAVTDIPFTVSGFTGGAGKVTVSFYATHTFDSDLKISLIGPDNTTVILSNQRGGSGDNFGTACSPDGSRITFDDAAATAIGSGSAPFVGSFRPDQALSVFVGKSGAALNGTWKLRFDDRAGGDTGTFLCGSVVISPASCAAGGSCGGGAVFTDTPLTVGVTVVKQVHIAELRTRIDAQRARFGLGGYPWTNQPLTVGTLIKSQHVLELRTALNQAYAAHGVSPPAPSYTDPGLPGGTLVKAVHITELRNAVIALEAL